MIAANTVKEIFFFGKPPTRLCEWMGASSSECEGSDPTKIDITVCSLVRKEKRFKTVKDRKPLICCLAIIANNLIWTRISFVGKECSSFLQVRESNCPEDSRYGNRKNTRPRLILQLLAWNRSQKKMKMKNKKKNSKLTKSKKKKQSCLFSVNYHTVWTSFWTVFSSLLLVLFGNVREKRTCFIRLSLEYCEFARFIPSLSDDNLNQSNFDRDKQFKSDINFLSRISGFDSRLLPPNPTTE